MNYDLIESYIREYFYILVLIVLYWYLLTSYGLFKLAKKEKFDYPWMAWIPFLKYFVMVKLIGGEIWGSRQAEFWLVFASMAAPIGFYMLVTGFGLVLPLFILTVIYTYFENAFYLMFQKYIPEKAKTYIILSILLPIILNPIFTVIVSKSAESDRTKIK